MIRPVERKKGRPKENTDTPIVSPSLPLSLLFLVKEICWKAAFYLNQPLNHFAQQEEKSVPHPLLRVSRRANTVVIKRLFRERGREGDKVGVLVFSLGLPFFLSTLCLFFNLI